MFRLTTRIWGVIPVADFDGRIAEYPGQAVGLKRTGENRMFRTPLHIVFLGIFAPLSAFATGQQRIETITAQVHSEMARSADTLPSARSHFHHVINCLVDPDNKLFDLRSGNPCAGMGSSGGALHDEAQTEAQKKELQHALSIAERGSHSSSLEIAHIYAEWLSEILTRANL